MSRDGTYGGLLLAGDSGGSKTEWRLLSTDDGVRSVFSLRGMAALHPGTLPCADIAKETAAHLPAGCAPSLVYLSLGGPNVDEVRAALRSVFPEAEIRVEREADGTLLAQVADLLDIQGAVLGGTGVTAVGFHGSTRRYADGWGPVFGDRGSGGGIGFEAVRTYLAGVDGVADAGRLGELFAVQSEGLDPAAFSGRMELKRRINQLSRRELAALAPQVKRLADSGDAAAARIIAEAAEAVGGLAAAVLPSGGRALWLGGLFRLGADFRAACEAALERRRPGEGCRSCYDERLSLGKIAASAALRLGGVPATDPLFEETLYGN